MRGGEWFHNGEVVVLSPIFSKYTKGKSTDPAESLKYSEAKTLKTCFSPAAWVGGLWRKTENKRQDPYVNESL